MKITIYSKMSCIASNDFIEYCKHMNLDTKTVRLQDKKYAHIKYDVTLNQVEEIYSRKFYTSPIIFINNKFVNSIEKAKKTIKEYLYDKNVH